MNIKVLGMTLLSAVVLFGCQAGDDEAMRNGNTYDARNTQYSPQDDGFNRVDYDNPLRGNGNGQNYDRVNNGENRYDISRAAARKITNQLNEIERAYVLTTDNNAYVAVVRGVRNGNNNEVNDNLKAKISDIVKSVDRDIDNVYVSANPDFFRMTNDYTSDIRNGEPVEGFFREFGQMIDRIFPERE